MKLELYYPVKPLSINQKFGQNNIPLYKEQGLPGHNGMDFMAKHGQPIYASHDGYASFQIDGSGGHGVVIITKDQYDYQGVPTYFKTIYWHMCDGLKEPKYQSPIADKTGFVFVKTGDLIGYADNTGASTGDHLHYGLKPVGKGEAWGTWYNTEQNNGYNGAIDPEPYLNGKFAEDFVNGVTKYLFKVDLKLGDKSDEVAKLQQRMKDLGFYHYEGTPDITGYYGEYTRAAIYAYQLNYVPMSFYEKYVLKGKSFGPKTREILNK